MNVILLEPSNLGIVGDVVKVKPGYARNYLIPRGMALPATRANLNTLEARVRSRQKQLAAEKAQAEALAASMKDHVIELSVKAGEGKIYGAITPSDVAERLVQSGFEVDRRKLVMDTIKETGEHELHYRAHPEVSVPLKLVVSAQK